MNVALVNTFTTGLTEVLRLLVDVALLPLLLLAREEPVPLQREGGGMST